MTGLAKVLVACRVFGVSVYSFFVMRTFRSSYVAIVRTIVQSGDACVCVYILFIRAHLIIYVVFIVMHSSTVHSQHRISDQARMSNITQTAM